MTSGAPSPRWSVDGSARHGRSARGQSLVEFALLIPFLVVLMMLAVDIGRAYLGWTTLTNVARIGANFAAQNPSGWEGAGNATVQARYRTLMSKDAAGINCTLPDPLPPPIFDGSGLGTAVRVELDCLFEAITPGLNDVLRLMKSDRPATQFNDADRDGKANLTLSASAVFTVRTGSVAGVVIDSTVPSVAPQATPGATTSQAATSTPTPAATPTPGPTLAPGATLSPTPAATPTLAATPVPVPLTLSFHGTTTSTDASGGGPPGSINESQIVGIPTMAVTFANTSSGDYTGGCLWTFGDGNSSSSCGNQVSNSYTVRGTYSVTLTVDGLSYTRSSYVLVGCKVPAFSGVRKNDALSLWTGPSGGFSASKLTFLPGSGNYKIGYQSLAGGLVNPQGGCSGASITVGP